MNIITILNEKGGVGKTTLTGNIAVGLAALGHKVLAIDSDGQGDLSISMGHERAPDFYELVKRTDVDVRNLVQVVPADVSGELRGQLRLVRGNNETWGIPSSTTVRDMVTNLLRRWSKLEKVFDYVIIDTQPSMTPVHEALVMLSDHVLLPTDAETFAALGGLPATIAHVEALNEWLRGMKRPPVNILGIVPNKYRARTTLHQATVDKMRETYGDLVWQPIPLRTSVPESQLYRHFLLTEPQAETLDSTSALWNMVARVEEFTLEGSRA